jgi:ATP-binding protein involved in chromosome partitioning
VLKNDKIKNIIAIGSGKGGVGKSTIAVNLALGLKKQGAQVGILDADIYGPSQPAMLGAKITRCEVKEHQLQPIECHGIQSMSIGYLIDPLAPIVWRGPMLGKALQQLLQDTAWGPLDYLIIDLPPGTGDVQLTLCQKIAVDGAILVTTPQDIALLDVRRASEMFNKLHVPILGVIENMGLYQCPQCGHQEHIFGEGGGARLAEEYGISLLGSIPLNKKIRELTDSGHPFVVADPTSDYANTFFKIARQCITALQHKPKPLGLKFPKVVVERSKDK